MVRTIKLGLQELISGTLDYELQGKNMSWNNALPWWLIELEHEHDLALMSCAFEGEWFAGTSRVMPDHVIRMSKATLPSWKFGGWNYNHIPDEFDTLE